VALAAIRGGLVRAAHDCSEGGLAVAVAEGCIAGQVGADLDLRALGADLRSDVLLFAEQPSRILLAGLPGSREALDALAREAGVALVWLGSTGGDTIRLRRNAQLIAGLPLAAATDAWQHGLARAGA
jgi:phosphoribosylformylglycinamidine synthase